MNTLCTFNIVCRLSSKCLRYTSEKIIGFRATLQYIYSVLYKPIFSPERDSGLGSPRKDDTNREDGNKPNEQQKSYEPPSNKDNHNGTNKPAPKADFLSIKPTEKDMQDDLDSLHLSDDDEEDIFEKARRKYNINLDSDDDL